MNVLSLFDGISCGRLALERAGIQVDKYYASEIEPNAIKIAQKNWADTIQLGDVTNWRKWNIDWSKIDLLIGGSPCQGFSSAGKLLNFNDPRSKLFFEYVDIFNHIKQYNSDVKFLLENVKMKKEWQDVISNYLGVKPIEIDSEIITPMRRKRNYWTNFQVSEIIPKHTTLKDVLDDFVDEKYYINNDQFNKLVEQTPNGISVKNISNKEMLVNEYDGVILSRTWQTYCPVIKGKSHAIRASNPDDVGVCVKDKYGNFTFRKFTLSEMERMQTLPVGYTVVDGVSERQSKQVIGNGWTVDVIAHIFSCIQK